MSWFTLYLSVYGYLFCSVQLIASQAPQELINTVANGMLSCMSEMPEDFAIDTCKELLDPSVDHSDEKYKACKCIGFCTCKNIGVMNEDGTGNRDKLKSMVDSLETEEWRQEGTMVLEKCSNLPGKGCDLAFNFMKCCMESSTMMREFIKTIMGSAK